MRQSRALRHSDEEEGGRAKQLAFGQLALSVPGLRMSSLTPTTGRGITEVCTACACATFVTQMDRLFELNRLSQAAP
jgi:hypothetical protein